MLSRRAFLRGAAASAAALSGLGLHQPRQLLAGKEEERRPVPEIRRTVIAGRPRERGRQYGKLFQEGIRSFLDREIYRAFIGHPSTREAMLGYAGACEKEIRKYSPVIHEELEGMAEGSGLRLEEVVLVTLHEELYHKGVLPPIEHCTAVAVGPPDTVDGDTYVGQTWDWMESVAGLSSVIHWKRQEGPSLLAYAYPGLWVGAGLNSAGLALTWTSADLGNAGAGARVGIPSYVLLAQLLYQESLEAAIAEARRASPAGWFTFVLGDAKGNLANIEGAPGRVAVEEHRGRLARVLFGSRAMTGTQEGAPVKLHPRCEKMYGLLAAEAGRIDRAALERFFGDPRSGICAGKATIDMMVYNTTRREAYLSRGPEYGADWKKFTFEGVA